MYRTVLDRVTEEFCKEPYTREFDKAREEYFAKTGKVFEDEPAYEIRMSSFLEWYLIDRPLYDAGVPPVRLYSLVHREESTPEERITLEGLIESKRSVFQLLSVEADHCVMKDVVDNQVHDVTDTRHATGMAKNDFADVRLYRLADQEYFTDAMWVYPAEAKNFILDEMKKRKTEGEKAVDDFLFSLAYMQLKSVRYKHVNVEEIYRAKEQRS